MLFSVKLKADTEEGTPDYADCQGGVIYLILGAVMYEWNECWGGRGVRTVCVWMGDSSACVGSRVHEMCRSNPSRSWPVQAGERETVQAPHLQKCSQHVHLCWAIARLLGFSGLYVFLLVSLGETVSLRDKIRQRYEGGASPKPPEQVSGCAVVQSETNYSEQPYSKYYRAQGGWWRRSLCSGFPSSLALMELS